MAYLGGFRKRSIATPPVSNRRKNGSGEDSSIHWENVRFHLVAVLFALLWIALWVRAGYLQLWDGPMLAERARRQHMTAETVAAPRGQVLDRNGHVLARSVECFSVYANPSKVTNVQEAAEKLSPILGIPVQELQDSLSKNRGFIWIRRKVDDATAEAVRQARIIGVELAQEYERIYPYRHVAGQLLGFVGMDGKGLEGVERSFDAELTGLSSRQVIQRDASGRSFYVEGGAVGTSEDVRLSIDLQVQSIAEEEIANAVQTTEAKWGGVLVADVENGDILAWAQYPFFNPNAYSDYKPAVYRNRLALDALEPGSTFKPFLIASALQEGLVTRDSVFNCENGLWRTKYITIRDDGRPQKEMTVAKILSYSSNIGCGKIGLELGAVRYHRYLSRLGFGERTGLEISESRGILRQPREWSEADVISASFGQSLSVTVIQMAQAYLTIGNGGVFRPLRLVIDDRVHVDGAEQRIFSRNTTRELLKMMQEVVESGTGSRAAIPGVSVAGKTGTAQKASRHGGSYGMERTGSFVGLVPADKPKYLVVIFIDEPIKNKYGGVIAAPVFKSVATRVLAYEGRLPDPGALTPAQQKAQERAEARNRKKQGQKKPEEMFMGEVRRELAPMKPDLKPNTAGKVPDVRGLSVRRAVEMFARQGLVPVVKGEGSRVVRQTPDPGVSWSGKEAAPQECVLWLSEQE